jgi:hypothetical protein
VDSISHWEKVSRLLIGNNSLMAKVGYQPRYVSRVMYANEMFELGARRVIGDEKQINIWGDIQMPEKHNFKVST